MRRLFALLAATLAVTGCAAQSNGAAAGWPAGHEFWSTSVTENGVERQLPTGVRIKLRLAATDPIVVAQADCNAINASGLVKPDRLVVTSIASTAMGCLGPAGSQDGFITDLLQASPLWRVSGDTLVLMAGPREIRLVDRRVADPDRPLVGTRWTITGGLDQRGAGYPTNPSPTLPDITFGGDGTLTGDTGCAALSGRITVKAQTVTIESLDRAAHPCDADAQRNDTIVTNVLHGTLRAQVAYSTLTLTNEDGNSLTLVAQ